MRKKYVQCKELKNFKVTCNGEELEQLTTWGNPTAKMGGVRGRPRYMVWLRAEKRRIKSDEFPREAKIVKHPTQDMVSLWVNERSKESIDAMYKRINGGY